MNTRHTALVSDTITATRQFYSEEEHRLENFNTCLEIHSATPNYSGSPESQVSLGHDQAGRHVGSDFILKLLITDHSTKLRSGELEEHSKSYHQDIVFWNWNLPGNAA